MTTIKRELEKLPLLFREKRLRAITGWSRDQVTELRPKISAYVSPGGHHYFSREKVAELLQQS